MRKTMCGRLLQLGLVMAGFGCLVLDTAAQTPPPVLDVKPAFMLVTTNWEVKTNVVIVTNYLVVTNVTRVTNYYNAAGQLLTPVGPQLTLLAPPAAVTPPKPAGPDPAKAAAAQLQAIRDLLLQGLLTASNQLTQPGAFTSNAATQIQIPAGVTALDRKRTDALIQAMNQTAERAAGPAAVVLAKSIRQLGTENPAAVLHGESDAATRLWLTAQGEALAQELLELVRRTGAETKLREAYAHVMLRGGGLLGAVLGTQRDVDIEAHVAQGLLQAFVDLLIKEEKNIRANPAARKTKPLQEVFAQ